MSALGQTRSFLAAGADVRFPQGRTVRVGRASVWGSPGMVLVLSSARARGVALFAKCWRNISGGEHECAAAELPHSGTSMRSQLAAVFLVFSLSANAQTLSGAIDMHAHADPNGTPRKIDAIDLARLAKERGMRAIVLKNHYEPTASLAYIVRKEVPGIEVFGGISLDLTVGGVNPAAVEWMTKVKGSYGRVVWLPTFDSEAQVRLTKQQRPFARVVRGGKVVPEVAQVIAIAARNNLVLETGHSSGSEELVIIQEAKRQGVENGMVTHALTNPGGPLTLSEIQQAARLGASIELVYGGPF